MTKLNKTSLQRPYPFEKIDPTLLAWLAGLLQAEAYFSSDERVRSTSNDPDYTPPPPVPTIKLEMVEKDLIDYVGKLVGQTANKQTRQTSAGKDVYRITIRTQAREKTEVFLRAILPYIVGEKNRSRIIELLTICDEYNKWLAEGGKSKAAKLAARSKKKKSKPADSN